MPVILLTGLPGNGKSLYTVSKIAERFKDRNVYYHNIKELKLPWLPVPDPERWYELPAGSVIIMDECQDIFPTRDGKTSVPEKCKRFETHRHQGLDIVLITQRPRQIDIHVRQLVGEHIHIERVLGSAKAITYTWPKVCEDVDDERQRDKAVKEFFNYPTDSYGLYKSAEVHTIKRKVPWFFWAFPVVGLGIAFAVHSAYNVLMKPDAQKSQGSDITLSEKIAPGAITQAKKQHLGYLEARTPEIADIPGSAPAYEKVTVPKQAPYPAACMQSRSQGCVCYSQQATRLEVSDSVCRQIVKQGFFMDWLQPPATVAKGGMGEGAVSPM